MAFARLIRMSAPTPGIHPPAQTGRFGDHATIGLWLAVTAAAGSLLASGLVGATIGPMQLENGPLLADSGTAYTALVAGLLASQILWAALGLTALILGILTLRRSPAPDVGRRRAGAAIAVTLAAPVLSFALFLVLVVLSVAD